MTAPPVVLVVEEHSELLNVLYDALQWEGYDVLAATDEVTAADVLRNRPVDLLISDPEPSEENHRTLAALSAEFPDLPVITLAAPDDHEDLFFRPWVTNGNRRTLRRPFRLSDLIAACREAMGEREAPTPDGEQEDA